MTAPLVDDDGNVFRWRHSAVRLPVIRLGGNFFVQVRPTIVFSLVAEWREAGPGSSS